MPHIIFILFHFRLNPLLLIMDFPINKTTWQQIHYVQFIMATCIGNFRVYFNFGHINLNKFGSWCFFWRVGGCTNGIIKKRWDGQGFPNPKQRQDRPKACGEEWPSELFFMFATLYLIIKLSLSCNLPFL